LQVADPEYFEQLKNDVLVQEQEFKEKQLQIHKLEME